MPISRSVALIAAVLTAAPALANDTMAELKTGGLTFIESPDVSMESEALFISAKEVRVDYVFENSAGKDVETLVAFPMPDLPGHVESDIAIADSGKDNFLDFTVMQDGKPISPTLQQRAIAASIDVTDDLKAQNIPPLPYAEGTAAALEKLPDAVKQDWLSRGLLYDDVYDNDGSGMKHHMTPLWTLRSTYWWKTVFPARAKVTVSHRYTPSVGGTVAISFLEEGQAKGDRFVEYSSRYCMDGGFVKTAQKLAKAETDGGANYTESWISYILKTGANWNGPIKSFKLTLDKGNAKNLISFCGTGVKKTGPTTFEMTATDFWPERDLDILILNAPEE
ncbi:DUF4424 domain-containing protein [Rhizobium sp. BG4]|uniref:DUF4424 domain-containing protein n=1 Tax=Rhizobium sp. BG4 TaxID=2613770 RepID=UPI00193E856A|nr:DUF4424 domain-containing protein [Rhizobium sp. BG4]QRM42907.1 DUF4424 domain-containing protein [Rhizobium sp. BG4]